MKFKHLAIALSATTIEFFSCSKTENKPDDGITPAQSSLQDKIAEN